MSEFEVPDDVLKGKMISPTHFVLKKLVREQSSYRVGFESLVELAQICLTQPLSNAVVERGASAVKRVKTRLRSSLKNDMLSSLLHITINGPHQESDEAGQMLTEATTIWRATHVRNLPKSMLPMVGGSDHNNNNIIQSPSITTEVSVQTEPQGKDVDEPEGEALICKLADYYINRAIGGEMGDTETDNSDYESDF